MNLIVVESPTKAGTLSRFLGKDYEVEATAGHVKDLPKSQLGVEVENNFEPLYVDVERKKENVDRIIKAAKKASKIYLATDPDREGEAISQHVKEILKGNDKKISRVVFHEITEEAVNEAIQNPRDIDKNLVDAQISRRVLDRLVGYNLSPLLWRKVRRGLSAGRVQSVTVRLIVEKEREIEKFKKDEYWEIYCHLKRQKEKGKSEEFIVQLIKVADENAEIKDGKDTKQIATQLSKARYSVDNVTKREVRKNPYPPFTTSTMTQAGARLFFWSAKRTMRIAQSLYEHGHITYHRTDSLNIAKSAITKLRDYIGKTFGEEYLPKSLRLYKKTSKVAQEAHEAIRPTDVTKETFGDKDSADEKKLYGLIWKRFVSSQMEASVSDETTIDVRASEKFLLRASGQSMKFPGWRKVLPLKDDGEISLPDVEKGEDLDLLKVDPIQKFTEPPARYNEASIIKTLEKLGIGRPSTYAPTISTIQVRNYVEKKEGKFFATPIGVTVTEFLMKYFPKELDYQFTAQMEGELDDVANGKLEWRKSIKTFWGPFKKTVDSVTKKSKRVKIENEKLGKPCPKCKKGELVIRIGRFGKFVSCSRFPDCDYTEKYLEKIGMVCPECKKGEVIVKTTGKWRKFFGCSRYPDCKFASWKNPKLAMEKETTEKESEKSTIPSN